MAAGERGGNRLFERNDGDAGQGQSGLSCVHGIFSRRMCDELRGRMAMTRLT
jgi:hypothetical protein